MDFTEIASQMYPYWAMGIFMLFIVYQSKHRDLLRVEPKSLLKWAIFLACVTAYRIIVFKILAGNKILENTTSGALSIPLAATLTVFWEDACHTLPLVILARTIGLDKWWKKGLVGAAIAMVMASFGLGHVYQGFVMAFFLSFYIPFTYKKGQQVGFGTVMICHILYDFITILTIKHFLG